MKTMRQLGKLIYLALLLCHLWATVSRAQADRTVLVIDVEGPVTPVMLGFIDRAITEADTRNVEALIIRLNTPGGSIDLTKQIIQKIIASEVPVVVYVWPPGGFAASAGTFITLAAHANAMAPNTSIGAASPVDEGGGDIDETLRSKIENILVADIKGLANRRGDKALEWAQKAVTEAKAAEAQEALEIGVIDFVAKDLDDLLAQLDGFKVTLDGEQITLQTKGAQVDFLETTTLEGILGVIVNPNVALLLISIGSLAILYEIINPGGYMSGVVGAILLLVGFYAVGQLPVNYAGLALILLAFILFGAELFTPTHGALTAGGIASFILGALILFNTSEFAYPLPWPSLVGVPLFMAAIITFGFSKVIQTMHTKPVTGREGMIGAIGTVKTALEPEGVVFVHGERWNATTVDGEPVGAKSKVQVIAIDGFQLTVRKVK